MNLEAVTYLDSSALGELVAAGAAVEAKGGEMKLVSSKRVNDVLVVSKLHMVFQVFETEAAAVDSFFHTHRVTADSVLSSAAFVA